MLKTWFVWSEFFPFQFEFLRNISLFLSPLSFLLELFPNLAWKFSAEFFQEFGRAIFTQEIETGAEINADETGKLAIVSDLKMGKWSLSRDLPVFTVSQSIILIVD